MSTEFYEDMAEMAAELIDEFGTDVVITRIAAGEPDPVTGEGGGQEQIHYQARGIVTSFRDDQIDGTLIRRGDKLIVIGPDVVPLEEGVISWGDMVAGVDSWGATNNPMAATVSVHGKTWSIQSIETKRPGDVNIVYKVHVRG